MKLDADNPDLGPFLLKSARDAIGENPNKALDYAIRAADSFQKVPGRVLELVAAINCSLGKFDEAVRVLQRTIAVPGLGDASDHVLAKFSAYMQLGDCYSMNGHLTRAIDSYHSGLKIQMDALGNSDPRVAETFRYLVEAHVQAMQFDEAEELCKKTLAIHRVRTAPASLEEAADRRLLAIVCEARGDHESALEHLVLASMSMIANGQDKEVASIDVSIGDIYSSLCRFEEAIFSYQKALTCLKSINGDDHPSVALVFIRLADLYYETGKHRESRSYCENALRIYTKAVPVATSDEIANGLTEMSAIYKAMDEPEEAFKLLQLALKSFADTPKNRSTIAWIEAQVGAILYIIGRYQEARTSFGSAIGKIRATGERKSAFFGILLNQMGLACVQLFKLDEAAKLFEEARKILEEYGSCHLDTLGVYSNLAATYDAMGRVEDAIEILDCILKVREEKLGTANPDIDDEKRRLSDLLKEVGLVRNRRGNSLVKLLDTKTYSGNKERGSGRSGFSFKA